MKKSNYFSIIKISLALLGTSSIALAEDNGWFIGGSYQVGGAVMKRHTNTNAEGLAGEITKATEQATTQQMVDTQNVAALAMQQELLSKLSNQINMLNGSKTTGINGIGIKTGYKQFFGKRKIVGLRYYAFFDWGYADFGKGILPNKKYIANLLNYGVGSDFLWNFIDKQNGSFGLFAGLDIGGATWATNGKSYQEQYFPNGKASYSNFQMSANFGLRTNIIRHHGFELGVKIPFIRSTLFSAKQISLNETNHTMSLPFSYKASIKRDFSITFSYLYTF